MKRLHEKMTMAAIILSCGFVMQTESPEPQAKTKAQAEARPKKGIQPPDTSASTVKPAKPVAKDRGLTLRLPQD